MDERPDAGDGAHAAAAGVLVRLEDTPEHRRWLNRMAGEVLKYMQPSGAIQRAHGSDRGQEIPGAPVGRGVRHGEASLIQENGDPACDLLYTANYAFLGLHEAAQATGDPMLRAAEGRLADFFCRVQVVSETVPYLNGVWMRSFDYEKWEYWGSSADLGWGPWCVETGLDQYVDCRRAGARQARPGAVPARKGRIGSSACCRRCWRPWRWSEGMRPVAGAVLMGPTASSLPCTRGCPHTGGPRFSVNGDHLYLRERSVGAF